MSNTETVRRKYRSGERKRRTRKRLERQFYSTVSEPREPVLEIPAELPQEPARVGNAIETALFERQSEAIPDAAMVRQSKRERWGTPKPLSEIVIQKALTLAAGLEWYGHDGKVRKEEWTAPQMIGAAKLALDIERQNQTEEHHDDRMDYAERALQVRSKVGDYRPPSGTAIGVETDGAARVSIYLPARDDDAEIPILLDGDKVDGAP